VTVAVYLGDIRLVKDQLGEFLSAFPCVVVGVGVEGDAERDLVVVTRRPGFRTCASR
jgi:hypothetical protein